MAIDQTGTTPDLKTQIANQLYKAIRKLTDDPELLSIIGSYGDTLDDADILSLLESYNETGSAFSTIEAAVDGKVRKAH